ncbi:MAG: 2,3-butanediol dehydrogenase [Spirochaetota bacterium]|nr:MAG: 2,3-butanediol dehydrogenase [Spirochaetota bacterium]
MKAAVWHGRKDVRVEDVPDPPIPPPGQVKVEVACCGICGTDLHEYLGGPIYVPAQDPHPLTGAKAPVILGHELSGKVVDVGDGVSRINKGDRVALCPIIGCLECKWCKSGLMGICPNVAFLGVSWHWGGFAKYVNVYEYMCYHLPEEVPYEVGALVEPFAATVRAVKRVGVKPEETFAVVGTGPVGVMALQAARIAGAGQIIAIEPAEKRQQLAIQCGATAVIDPVKNDAVSEINTLTGGEGVDVVIECAGLEKTGLLAGHIVKRTGRIMVMGVFEEPAVFDFTDLVYGEKTVMGSMGGYGVFDDAIQMMAKKKFNGQPLITGKIKLDDIVSKGFDALIRFKEKHAKILVIPD